MSPYTCWYVYTSVYAILDVSFASVNIYVWLYFYVRIVYIRVHLPFNIFKLFSMRAPNLTILSHWKICQDGNGKFLEKKKKKQMLVFFFNFFFFCFVVFWGSFFILIKVSYMFGFLHFFFLVSFYLLWFLTDQYGAWHHDHMTKQSLKS